MKWRLPQNTTRCPVNRCHEAFEDRSALKFHYQQQHASHMVLCKICDKPLAAVSLEIYLKHYRERHANSGPPINLIRSMRKSIHGRPTEHVSLIVLRLFLFSNLLLFHTRPKYEMSFYLIGLRWK